MKVIESEVNKDENLQQYLMNKMMLALGGISLVIVVLTIITGFVLFKYYKE